MQDYTVLRELAGSIGTVFLVLSFAGFVLFALRPGSRGVHRDTADIPFRHDDRPAADADAQAAHAREPRQ
ncbi:cbb3-type cytochrome c oxidase subunit 3 [Gymnodinialimonas ceratoperidinii]|uniref:Cbb3-type cytochrome c oxidase subunit 3 n=1 Tax=Gymnodinialimonas ceratoperidinii TaxID=2856823 RepID=A0A8F6TY92_9RHOB|nr:cbb3-type cytochrome c oxidase subunit 3 [Gymnodinialimonas ceratoperidinii]QXT40384.1 cbb3-type cytochrome c oxidase subunit 3 [Gymnodinialimonas ceratoperidinii]